MKALPDSSTALNRQGTTGAKLVSSAICPPIHRLLWNKYYIDELYTATLVMPTRLLGRFTAWFDLNTIDWVVNLVGKAGKFGGWAIEIVDRIVVVGEQLSTQQSIGLWDHRIWFSDGRQTMSGEIDYDLLFDFHQQRPHLSNNTLPY